MIGLLHPSRGRPEKANATRIIWQIRSNYYQSVYHVLSVDNDDLMKDLYFLMFADSSGVEICRDNISVVQATNEAAKKAYNEGSDIMVYLSDDFDCPSGWDELIRKEFEGVDGPMLLKVDDCLQKFHVPVLTIPIMNRALYERLGYFWHPEYKSMFVDEDLYWTCKNNGWLKECPHLKFPHNHHSTGACENDETYKRSAANWDHGKEVFQRRKKEGFPL